MKQPETEIIQCHRLLEVLPAAGPGELWKTTSPTGGYRLLECLSRNVLGEVWRAETLSGSQRLIRMLFGVDALEQHSEGVPLDRLRAVQDDALAPVVYLADGPTRLAVISDPGTLSLAGRFRCCQAEGLPGIPRHELIYYLRFIANGLDALTAASGLQHLSLTPAQIFVGAGRPRMVDFALAELFWLSAGQQVVALNPRSTPPELLQGKLTSAADQYALAAMYQELLTGCHPFRQLSQNELLAPKRPEPDLAMLSSADRTALARALSRNPKRRFPSCRKFVAALEGKRQSSPQRSKAASSKQQPAPHNVSRFPPVAGKRTSIHVVSELVQAATGAVQLREVRGIRYLLRPGQCIEHRCFARIVAGTAWLKLDAFRQRWQATAAVVSADHFRFRVTAEATLWDRLWGRKPGLEVHVRLRRPPSCPGGFMEMAIDVFPLDQNLVRGGRMLEQWGPLVLESVRHYLQVHKDRRIRERLPFDQLVQIWPVFPDLRPGEPMEALAKDISLHGIGLRIIGEPKTNKIAIRLPPTDAGAVVTVSGEIVRASLAEEGQYDVGINFAFPSAAPLIRLDKATVLNQ